ncbi:MAG: nickel-dependent lactate racemase [candidate division WOR-3 bacterium]
MELKVKYGESFELVKLPAGVEVKVLSQKGDRAKKDLEPLVKKLKEGVRDFLSDANSLLIIVNDYTRPTPTEMIISHLEEEIRGKEFSFLIALGSHRPPKKEEYERIFGKFYHPYQERIVCHDAKDRGKLVFLGKTSFGTPVALNELLFKHKKIMVINSVEPHYFAGFTGGRKSFVPGVAGYETITLNHKLSLSPKAKTLNLIDNPVSRDMEEVSLMVPRPIFSIQLVIDQNKNLRDIKFGELSESFLAGVKEAEGTFCLPIEKLYDVVLALVQPPYDVDLYQSQKALENAKLGVKEGGVIILVSSCREGVGDDEFIRVMRGGKSPKEVIAEIEKNFVLGAHKSAKLAELVSRFEVLAVVPISEDIINSLFMKRMGSISEAFDHCLRKFGRSFSLLFLPDASLVTPIFRTS